MDRLVVGMHVEIVRSDGRIHGALVTKLSPETSAINVEWFEKGETKGKEVDLSVIMRHNPMLFQPSIPSAVPPPKVVLRNNPATAQFRSNQPEAKTRESILLSNQPHFPRKDDPPPLVPPPARNRRSMAVALSTAGLPQPSNFSSNAENEVANRRVTTSSKIPPARNRTVANTALMAPVAAPVTVVKKEDVMDETSIISTKPSVVAKIENIAKNREQRRVQQVEVKKLCEVQKNIDSGNPNWQFLSMIRDYQSQVDYKPLKITDPVKDNRISVCVRKRPINKKELAKKEVEIITIPKSDHIIVHQPQTKVDLTKYLENQVFRFDYTFDESSSNEMVYKFTAQPLVRTIFQGGFATCFAYGQTGSGKTHTMGGGFDGKAQNCANGIYAMTAIDVFKMLASKEFKNLKLSVSCSFFEIYGAKVFDLLGKKAKLRVLEDGKKLVQIVGLKEFRVDDANDVLQLIRQGSDQRTAGTTSANANSSRSHAVFQIILRKKDKQDTLHGKFSLIDLAGNERGADTISSDRQTRLEGAEINKSLLALKECIRAMGRDVHHIPFRGSKLTLILRDSFIGKNAKTCMIAMISPGMSCVENTLNTLRYADRVKELASENDDGTATLREDDFLMPPGDEDDVPFDDDDDDRDEDDRNI